jgi:hypothetical protein
MIVFNLGCGKGHRFDGWFASSEQYESQQRRGMLECPVCGDKAIRKLLSAPRLNLSGGSAGAAETGAAEAGSAAGKNLPVTAEAAERARMLAAQTEFYKQLKDMLETSDDVGDRFAEEARRIHYKETPARHIHGVTTREEAVELLEEGVSVLPLPFAIKRKDELN